MQGIQMSGDFGRKRHMALLRHRQGTKKCGQSALRLTQRHRAHSDLHPRPSFLFQMKDRSANLERRIGFNHPCSQFEQTFLWVFFGTMNGDVRHAQFASGFRAAFARLFAEALGERGQIFFRQQFFMRHEKVLADLRHLATLFSCNEIAFRI